jgi:hypothetical protein
MQAFRSWIVARGPATALITNAAVLVGIQIAGFGVPFRSVDLVCALVLCGVAGFFHYDFVDCLAVLERTDELESWARGSTNGSLGARLRASLVGCLAFLFSALGVVMLVRALVS